MDYWIEDLNWREECVQQGPDDWDFYQEKYGFSQGKRVNWRSRSLKELASYAHSSPHFRIKRSLNKDEWVYIMGILARINVNQIEHIELVLPRSSDAVQMKSLTSVLRSGRISRLQTLRMRSGSSHYRKEEFDMISVCLSEVLRTGRFTNLLTLSLPFCDGVGILRSLIAGKISQLRSLSMAVHGEGLGRAIRLASISQAVSESGCLKSLQHLGLHGYGRWINWSVYVEGFIAPEILPNLTSVSLNGFYDFPLPHFVPFLLRSLNPLENLIVTGGLVTSDHVRGMVGAIMENPITELALKHLDLSSNQLDDSAGLALVHLANSDKLAQLRELDLSKNGGLDPRTVLRLKETILSGHLRSLTLLIYEERVVNVAATKVEIKEVDQTDSEAKRTLLKIGAMARPYQTNSGLSDHWFHVTCYPVNKGESKTAVRRNVELHLFEHYTSASRSEDVLGTELVGTVPPEDAFSTLKMLILKMEPFDGFEEMGTAIIGAALRIAGLSSLLGSLTALPIDELTISLPPSHIIEIVKAFSAFHTNQWRSFSIKSRVGLDDLSRHSLFQKLDAVFQSGFFNGLQHLELSGGVLDGMGGWKPLIQAIRSGHLKSIRSMRLSQNALNLVDLADLTPLLLSSSFEVLAMPSCWISSDQVVRLADAIKNEAGTRLALKTLDLGDNLLGNRVIEALVNLANSDFFLQLESLNLSMNKSFCSRDLIRLMETIQRGHLPSLDILIWGKNAVNDDAVHAMMAAYYEGFTVLFDIDWNQVEDVSLKKKAEEYRERNMRLTALKVTHKEILVEEVPLTRAKVFLGGYPEVGKTTLRRALTQTAQKTHPFKETRTRGIELSYLEGRNVTLTLWDLAGHEEYHVLHGTFFPDLGLASGRATTFVLVFKASFEEGVERNLLYWLRFAASSSQKFVRRHVVVVLNCFEGQHCTDSEKSLWVASLRHSQEMFKEFLDILPDPFVMDVRSPTVVEPLKKHLFEKTEILLRNVKVPKVCFELQETVKTWSQSRKQNGLPIMSWQAFEMHLNVKHTANQSSGRDFKVAALYLHEMGLIVYFDNEKLSGSGSSERRSIVVLDPDWFCSKVVGELLLPEKWLDGKCPLRVNKDGSIARHLFETYFKDLLSDGTQSDDVILMLERLGLCFTKNATEIIIPALIQRDDYKDLPWEDQASDLVMGRCLAVEDHERTAIPVTLFRRLQVELAKDLKFGGRGDSEYRAGKSFSCFNVGALLVLTQFDVDDLDPTHDRIDILVKNVIQENPTIASLAQSECICEIVEKLEKLCVACCPGLRYDIKAIKPWSATQETPEMIDREVMSLREMKVLLMMGEQYSGWRVAGNPVELRTFLSENELEKVLEVNQTWRLEMGEVTDELNAPKAVEETDALDYWSSSEVSEGSEDGGDLSQNRIELHENSGSTVSVEALGGIGEPNLLSTPLNSATSSSKSFVPLLRQLDDMVFEVYNPQHLKAPELEVVFFHGLKLQDQRDTYLSTWMTRDNLQLWLRTLLVPEFPSARILIVSYDSSPMKTYTEGLLDMYLTAENLLGSLTSDDVKLGRSGRRVVLVGHCLGGLVIKELCLMAAGKLNRMKQGASEMERIKNFFDSLQGMFFFATPHAGSPMVDLLQKYIQAEGLLLDQMEILNKHCARQNMEFEQLRQRRKWLIHGVGESRKTFLGFLEEPIFVVPEASARHDMDSFRTADADHFDVCKPDKSSSSSFRFLANFLRQILDAERGS